MNGDEVILQRKNKFLQIGRGRGFSTNTENDSNLSLRKNNMTDFVEKITNNKKNLLVGLVLILMLAAIIYLL